MTLSVWGIRNPVGKSSIFWFLTDHGKLTQKQKWKNRFGWFKSKWQQILFIQYLWDKWSKKTTIFFAWSKRIPNVQHKYWKTHCGKWLEHHFAVHWQEGRHPMEAHHPARDKLLTMMNEFALTDIFRERNLQKISSTYESKALKLTSRIDLFLIAQHLTKWVERVELQKVSNPPDHPRAVRLTI